MRPGAVLGDFASGVSGVLGLKALAGPIVHMLGRGAVQV